MVIKNHSGLVFYSDISDLLGALATDILAAVTHHCPGGAAKDAGRFILLQHDPAIFHEYLQLIPFRNIQRAAQLNRQDDSSKIVDLANNTSRLHDRFPLRFNVCRCTCNG